MGPRPVLVHTTATAKCPDPTPMLCPLNYNSAPLTPWKMGGVINPLDVQQCQPQTS